MTSKLDCSLPHITTPKVASLGPEVKYFFTIRLHWTQRSTWRLSWLIIDFHSKLLLA